MGVDGGGGLGLGALGIGPGRHLTQADRSVRDARGLGGGFGRVHMH